MIDRIFSLEQCKNIQSLKKNLKVYLILIFINDYQKIVDHIAIHIKFQEIKRSITFLRAIGHIVMNFVYRNICKNYIFVLRTNWKILNLNIFPLPKLNKLE